MRWALLLALAACGGDECTPLVGSRVSYRLGDVASGEQLAGVSWVEQFGSGFTHVAIVRPDGTLSPDIPSTSSYGVAGKSTVLWHRDSGDSCAHGEKFEFNPLLYDGANTIAVPIAPFTIARTAVFDGTRYQLFWTVPTGGVGSDMFHRTLDEDGTLGPIHDLDGLRRDCVHAATDGHGTTLLVTELDAYLVDSAGTKVRVWETATYNENAEVFYFAGEFHIDGIDFWSIDPVTKATRTRTKLGSSLTYYPTPTKLFALTGTDIVEIDASFAVIGHTPRRGTNMSVGTIGDDLLFITQRPLDTGGAKRITVERNNQTTELAVDSPTETLDTCQ